MSRPENYPTLLHELVAGKHYLIKSKNIRRPVRVYVLSTGYVKSFETREILNLNVFDRFREIMTTGE